MSLSFPVLFLLPSEYQGGRHEKLIYGVLRDLRQKLKKNYVATCRQDRFNNGTLFKSSWVFRIISVFLNLFISQRFNLSHFYSLDVTFRIED